MDLEFSSISATARAGMNYERATVELIGQRLALANVAFASAEAAQAASRALINQSQQINSAFVNHIIGSEYGSTNEVESKNTDIASAVRVEHDPGHPLADSEGKVYYIKVDHVSEMARMTTAIRAYEANIRAYNSNSEMNSAAMQIGGQN